MRLMIDVNMFGAMRLCRALLPCLLKGEGGAILQCHLSGWPLVVALVWSLLCSQGRFNLDFISFVFKSNALIFCI